MLIVAATFEKPLGERKFRIIRTPISVLNHHRNAQLSGNIFNRSNPKRIVQTASEKKYSLNPLERQGKFERVLGRDHLRVEIGAIEWYLQERSHNLSYFFN